MKGRLLKYPSNMSLSESICSRVAGVTETLPPRYSTVPTSGSSATVNVRCMVRSKWGRALFSHPCHEINEVDHSDLSFLRNAVHCALLPVMLRVPSFRHSATCFAALLFIHGRVCVGIYAQDDAVVGDVEAPVVQEVQQQSKPDPLFGTVLLDRLRMWCIKTSECDRMLLHLASLTATLMVFTRTT